MVYLYGQKQARVALGLASPFSKLKNFSFLLWEAVILTDLQINPSRTVPGTSCGLPRDLLSPMTWGSVPRHLPLEGWWWLISPQTAKLDTNDSYFIPDIFGFSQPSLRAVLHLRYVSHWLKTAAAQNTQAYERIKISHFDWFRKLFPTTHSLRVSVFFLTNWGRVGGDQAKTALGRSSRPGAQDPRSNALPFSVPRLIHRVLARV